MNELVSIAFNDKPIRSTLVNGEPFFALKDILAGMESTTTVTAAKAMVREHLGDAFVSNIPIPDAMGREQKILVVSKYAALFLLSRANTEQAKALNKFLFTDVLPQLELTGSYTVNPSALNAEENRHAALITYLSKLSDDQIATGAMLAKHNGANIEWLSDGLKPMLKYFNDRQLAKKANYLNFKAFKSDIERAGFVTELGEIQQEYRIFGKYGADGEILWLPGIISKLKEYRSKKYQARKAAKLIEHSAEE